jgi:hypothetical protein
VVIDEASDELLVLTVVFRVVTRAAKDEDVFVSVVLVVAMLAESDALLLTIALFRESMRVAAEEEFVVTVAFVVLMDDRNEAEDA